MVSEEEALRFIEIVEARVQEQSKSNLFVICLNPVKLGCQLVQLLERLGRRFSFLRV